MFIRYLVSAFFESVSPVLSRQVHPTCQQIDINADCKCCNCKVLLVRRMGKKVLHIKSHEQKPRAKTETWDIEMSHANNETKHLGARHVRDQSKVSHEDHLDQIPPYKTKSGEPGNVVKEDEWHVMRGL